MVFSDITPSSWRQGEALVRQLLGPVRHVGQLHSPPTHDTLKNDGQSRASVDSHSKPVTAASISDHPLQILCDVETSQTQHTLENVDEDVDLKDDTGSAFGRDNKLADLASNPRDLSIEQPTLHNLSVKLTGNFCNLL